MFEMDGFLIRVLYNNILYLYIIRNLIYMHNTFIRIMIFISYIQVILIIYAIPVMVNYIFYYIEINLNPNN